MRKKTCECSRPISGNGRTCDRCAELEQRAIGRENTCGADAKPERIMRHLDIDRAYKIWQQQKFTN